ncbi:MAG: hypothetical protein HY326_04915 [Chloroflexi bacterium]|nr:hypothetical protein [Chloroflexota bacterium]
MQRTLTVFSAVMATAIVLAYTATFTFSSLHDFAIWPLNVGWLTIISLLCGALLSIISKRSLWLIVASALLGVVFFGGMWSYIALQFLGQLFNFSEIILSDFVFLYVVQQGTGMFMFTSLFGLVGAVAARVIIPDQYLP